MLQFRKSVNLVKFMQKKKKSETVNLLDDVPAPKEKVVEEEVDENYYPYWKGAIDCNLIFDTTEYNMANSNIPKEVAQKLKLDFSRYTFEPIVYLSDFWVLKKHMTELNDTIDGQTANLTLKFKNYG